MPRTKPAASRDRMKIQRQHDSLRATENQAMLQRANVLPHVSVAAQKTLKNMSLLRHAAAFSSGEELKSHFAAIDWNTIHPFTTLAVVGRPEVLEAAPVQWWGTAQSQKISNDTLWLEFPATHHFPPKPIFGKRTAPEPEWLVRNALSTTGHQFLHMGRDEGVSTTPMDSVVMPLVKTLVRTHGLSGNTLLLSNAFGGVPRPIKAIDVALAYNEFGNRPVLNALLPSATWTSSSECEDTLFALSSPSFSFITHSPYLEGVLEKLTHPISWTRLYPCVGASGCKEDFSLFPAQQSFADSEENPMPSHMPLLSAVLIGLLTSSIPASYPNTQHVKKQALAALKKSPAAIQKACVHVWLDSCLEMADHSDLPSAVKSILPHISLPTRQHLFAHLAHCQLRHNMSDADDAAAGVAKLFNSVCKPLPILPIDAVKTVVNAVTSASVVNAKGLQIARAGLQELVPWCDPAVQHTVDNIARATPSTLDHNAMSAWRQAATLAWELSNLSDRAAPSPRKAKI